ncbi:MAG TPA: hypothetical protein VN650_10175 [Gemmatimonadaceae bacterium]|nr:hypothetical protein [Gemmatimonadaceae bacterium]
MTALVACVPLLAGALGAQATTSDRLPGQGGQGLTLMLLPPSPETHQPIRYVLSEPAYVAAFLVYPGAGVRLLYPLVDQREKLHTAGYNSDELIGASFDNDIYNVVLGPNAHGIGPVYLYMVASRRPLDVARYVHKPMTLASAVGEKESRSFYSDVAFDALLNNAVSLGDDDSWDSDVYILWPSVDGSARGRTQLARVLCADGTAREVPIDYPFAGCPGQQHVLPVAQVLRPVQRTAAGDAQSASPSFANGPTVLPTIVGDRAAAAEQRAARARAGEGQGPMIITAANGDAAVAQVAPSAAAVGSQVELFEGSGRAHDRARREDNGLRAPYSPEQRQEWRQQHPGARVGGSPTLAPNPRLSPNPSLSPNPGFSPSPGMGERQRAAPRFEAPRPMGSSPPPVRSAPSVGQLPAPSKGSSMPAKQDH